MWLCQYNDTMGTRARSTIQKRWHPVIVGIGAFFGMCHAQAQTTTSVVYVCQENGVLTLRNTSTRTNAAANYCDKKTITLPTFSRSMGDPVPTAQTLIVGLQVPSMVQQQRDFGRMRIVQAELNAAQQRLMKLQMEYNHGQPERMGNEKKDRKYLDRVVSLKQNIEFTQSNIEALKRELTRIHAAR